MIVVSNTTPLIGLASIERFDLLQQMFGEIHIPQAVYDEAVVAGREEGGAKREVSAAKWIKTVQVQDRLAVSAIRSDVDRLHRQGFGISQSVMRAVLEEAGEY